MVVAALDSCALPRNLERTATALWTSEIAFLPHLHPSDLPALMVTTVHTAAAAAAAAAAATGGQTRLDLPTSFC